MPATPVPAPATVVARNVVSGPWTKPQVEVIRPDIRTVAVPPRRTRWALVAISAYGFFMLGIGINVWNAMTGGAPTDMALPAALGVLAEAVVFFLPAWSPTLPVGRRMLAWIPAGKPSRLAHRICGDVGAFGINDSRLTWRWRNLCVPRNRG
jgi:hypothetical protein